MKEITLTLNENDILFIKTVLLTAERNTEHLSENSESNLKMVIEELLEKLDRAEHVVI
jgi:hypothetical protein